MAVSASCQVGQQNSSIPELLAREMKARNWSQREMAKACRLSNTTISKIVRGQSVPDPNTCFKLARGLGLPAPYILRMAGHEIADAQSSPLSLESFLHARFEHLPNRAIQEMLGAIRAIESAYTTPSTHDIQEARRNLDALEFVRRWLDPVKRKVLTVVRGGNFLFYQTADLDLEGREIERSELLPVSKDIGRLAMLPAHRFANSFCVQLYPLCEFNAHWCHAHPVHATIFTPLYAGDRGTGVIVVYPDGRRDKVRDQAMEQVRQRLYADLPDKVMPTAQTTHDNTHLPAAPDEIWLNPDARTYAAFYASPQGDTTYHLLTGPLKELSMPISQARARAVDTSLYGRFETSIVHLQGFCLKLYPTVEHITAARHLIPAHRVLTWSERHAQHVCVLHEYLETWLHLRINEGETSIEVIEDTHLRAESGRRRLERLIGELESHHIPYADSRPPGK